MQLPLPLLKNVVLVGGGHAHALVLKRWGMKPVAGAHLTIINPQASAPYTGMLPGFVAGHYERDELDIDLVKLARFAGARLVLGPVTAIDRGSKLIHVPGRPSIPYDVCSINVGVTSAMPAVPGFDEHALAVKPMDDFARNWSQFVQTLTPDSRLDLAVIGGGVGGCELALAMSHRLNQQGHKPAISVIDRSSGLGELSSRARAGLLDTLAEAAVELVEHEQVAKITGDQVICESGREISSSFTVTAAGARPHEWLASTGLTDDQGFITIEPTLQSSADPSVFAAGDCAEMTFDPRPKAGVFAVRQAPTLFHNLRASVAGTKLDTYDPQRDYLKLISLGSKRAAAEKLGRFVQGANMWRLKDRIDRDFMKKFDDLPEMASAKLPRHRVDGLAQAIEDEPPLCGGCGAKVGSDVLAGPLASLPSAGRTDIVRLPGDDAALLDFGGVRQVITTDTVRSFTNDPYRMAKIAALHAMGDIWAMGAMPQAVLVTVTLPQLGRSLQSEWLAEIMAGAAEVLVPTGAEIVGGHTSMGAELSLGFSITGLLHGEPVTLAGAEPGQHLVLTRPIGSGVLFAAEMQTQARGRDIAELLAELERPQGAAASILVEAGATAMTDVTGFGLAGHLHGMLRESHVAAELRLDDIALFSGALELSRDGVHSHLYAANQVGVPITVPGNDDRTALLFDPQTAGGFLAAVPAANAEVAVGHLRAAHFDAAIIGSVVVGEPAITMR